jgi:hypothetical protein
MTTVVSTTYYGVPGSGSLYFDNGKLFRPRQLAIDPVGNLYVKSYNRILKIAEGEADTIAQDDYSIILNGIAATDTGDIYTTVFTIASHYELWTSIGSPPYTPPLPGPFHKGIVFLAGDTAGYADGSGGAAKFGGNSDKMVVANNGDLYIYDIANARLRRVSGDTVSTAAGTGTAESTDGDGTAAGLRYVRALCKGPGSLLYLIDWLDEDANTYALRTFDTETTTVETLYTFDPGTFGMDTSLFQVTSTTWASDGSLYMIVLTYLNDALTYHILKVPDSDPGEEPLVVSSEGTLSYTQHGELFNIVADNLGNLFFTVTDSPGSAPNTLAHTIQKISNAFLPAGNYLSTLIDDFNDESNELSSDWTPVGLSPQITSGIATLGDIGVTASLESAEEYIFDSVYAEVSPLASASFTMLVKSVDDPLNYAQFYIDRPAGTIRADAWYNSVGGTIVSDTYNPTNHRWLKIAKTGPEAISFSTSANGTNWVLFAFTFAEVYPLSDVTLTLRSEGASSINNVNTLGIEPSEEDDGDIGDDPADDDPYGDTDPGDDDAEVPEEGEPPSDTEQPDRVCSTMIDLVRTFSSYPWSPERPDAKGVNQAIRIIGPNTIERVSTVEGSPLPDGWTSEEASDLYYSISREVQAPSMAVSGFNKIELTANASMRTDDVRILASGWQIPSRLPVHGLPPALVKSIQYTFTKEHFNAEVEFYFRPIPQEVRRT